MRREKVNYISNPEFQKALVAYHEKVDQHLAEGKEIPEVSREIGFAIMQICNRLSSKGNFYGYPFREDMIGDGIEVALKSVLKYNPKKYNNPFAYFTRCIWNAFIKKIKDEKRELLRKKKYYDAKYVGNELVDTKLAGSSYQYVDRYVQNDYMDDLHKEDIEKNEVE